MIQRGGFQSMWVIVLFDLPTTTKKERKQYSNFRKSLLESGFLQMQFSVYARFSSSPEKADSIQSKVVASLPPNGEVRILRMTDNQYARMRIFRKKAEIEVENAPTQLCFF
ncbi:MAG: CRISPR-associated endonuclease Cas2 [Verrucomicrobiota bacterium]